MTNTPALMPLFKLIAGGYLGYLGFSILRSHRAQKNQPKKTMGAVYDKQKLLICTVQGFLTCLVNPKAIMFFIALYSTVINPISIAQGYFFVFIVIPAFIWFTTLSFLLTAQRTKHIIFKLQTKVLLWVDGYYWCLVPLRLLIYFVCVIEMKGTGNSFR